MRPKMSHAVDKARAKQSPRPRGVRALARNQDGTTAIEFALLALPFFGLLTAILQTAMVFLAAQLLDAAVYDASRLIQTGQAQAASFNHTNFRDRICAGLYGIFDCSQLKLKVTTWPSTAAEPLEADGSWSTTWTSPTDYTPGAGSQVVQIQAFYKWPVPVNIGGLFGGAVGVSADGTKLLGASYVFMNEPFT